MNHGSRKIFQCNAAPVLRSCLLLVLFLILAGCGGAAKLVTPESTKLEVKPTHLQQFRVSEVTSATMRESRTAKQLRTIIRAQLETTLVNFDYLQPVNTRPAHVIVADIKEIIDPMFGLGITVGSTIQFKVSDPGGNVVLDKTLVSKGRAEFSESFVGSSRKSLAAQRWMERLLTDFMTELTAIPVVPVED